MGVSGRRGREKLYISKSTGTHSIYSRGDKFIKVDVITLEDIFVMNRIQKCDFLKMDCEGAEYGIIFNTSPKYLRRIRKISLEHHPVDGYTKEDLINVLEGSGFIVLKSNLKSIYAKRLS